MAITQQVIAKLKPDEKPFEVRDERIKGFLLRVQPSGRKSFIVEYRRGKRITLGSADVLTLTQARQMAVDILGQCAQGKDPMAERKAARAGTLGEFLDKHYAPWAESHQKASTDTVTRVRKCFPDLLQKQLGEITPWLIEKYRFTRQKQGIAASTLNRDVAALKAVLGRAEAWGTVPENPLKGLKMAKVDRTGVVRFLAPAEERRLLAMLKEAPAYLRTMVLVSLHTGVRRGELFSLEWRDLDLERRTLTIRGETSKSRQTRHIPLNGAAHAALSVWAMQAVDAQPTIQKSEGTRGTATAGAASSGSLGFFAEGTKGTRLVFPGKDGNRLDNTRKSFLSLLKAAGIQEFRWHDLRHHFASKLVMAGVDLTTAQELLGHHDPKVTLIYAHLSPEHKAAAVARLMA